MKNNPLLGEQSADCRTLILRSFWDVSGDHNYSNTWPRDRPLPFVDNAVVIVYTERGKGTVALKQGESLDLRGTSLVFLDPQTISHYWCDSGYWKLYWIEVIPSKELIIPHNKIINIDSHTHFHLDFMNLISALKHSDDIHRAYAVSILNKMIHEWLLADATRLENRHEAKVHAVIDEMHQRLMSHWHIKEMADFAGYSEQYFRKIFKSYMHISPKQFFNELKLEVILGQLRKGDITIHQLAEQYGFTDAYHLSSAFKKKYGCSPSRMKNSLPSGVHKIF